MIITIVFTLLLIVTATCIVLVTEEEKRSVILSFVLILIMFTGLLSMDLMELLMQTSAIKNKAAYWDVKVNPITGNSTKVFKWGQPVNEPNEQQANEINEPNELKK